MNQATIQKSNHKYPRCYEDHPPLKIGEYVIYGGSCSSPIVTNADVYVGFDHSMSFTERRFPWAEGDEFLYPIQDMGVPSNIDTFKALIDWLSVQLIAKKIVHIGCIGGHGRTGLVLAALVTKMTGEVDSITYVRKNYCEKAVESTAQVRFLNQHFGIKEVSAYKSQGHSQQVENWYSKYGSTSRAAHQQHPTPVQTSLGLPTGIYEALPVANPISIWGSHTVFAKPKKRDIIKPIQEGV